MISHSLTRGWVGLVDDEDADLATGFCVNIKTTGNGYAVRGIKTGKRRKSGDGDNKRHRIILTRKLGRTLLPHEEVDHIKRHDAEMIVDDRRENLRVVTRTQNQRNKRKRTGTSSTFKGVFWDKSRHAWLARIKVNKYRFLGRFATELDAARAYDVAALYLFGDFALLNCDLFPDLVTWKRAVAA